MILIHIEPFSLHLSSQQLLCHLKGVLQTLDHQSPLRGGGSVCVCMCLGGEGSAQEKEVPAMYSGMKTTDFPGLQSLLVLICLL